MQGPGLALARVEGRGAPRGVRGKTPLSPRTDYFPRS